MVAGLVWPSATWAGTGINHEINFQGKVVNSNGTNVTNGSYSFTFKLYDDPTLSSGGHLLWTETKTLTVTDGVFQTNLGDTTTLPGSVDFNTDSLYLGINFNSDGEMTPRIQLTAAPYAFNSEKLGGLTASQFAQLSPGSAQSGFLNVTGNITSGATVAATTSLQAPLVDTASAVALNIGTGTASSVTVGRTTTPFTIQGNSSSTFTATNGANTTTVSFTTPTAARAINFPDAGGTLCTTTASTCSATYQVASPTGYLAKNTTDTSTFAVTAANYLYGFTNSSSAVASGVLKLDNGSNTGDALLVTASGNAGSGNALAVVNGTGTSGNLIDLQKSGVSELAVDINGNVTQNGGTSTTDTINGQTISSAANFTGTVTAATSLLAPLLDTASAGVLAVGTTNATGINLNQNTTVASNKSLTADGSALFEDATNANTAFRVQNQSAQNLLQVDTLNNNIVLGGNNSGALQAWATNATPVTSNRFGATSVVANGYVYVIGGSAGTSITTAASTVYYGRLNSNGSVQSWTAAANTLPQVITRASSVVANGYVYVLGGSNATTDQSTVYYAKLNSDGSVGSWVTAANALPVTRNGATSVVANGYIYEIGGGSSAVYYAKLNADGSVGSWTTSSHSLPLSRTDGTSVVANGFVYVLGGSNSSAAVYYAQLNSDGSTGSFSTAANSLPASLTFVSSVVADGYVYVLGGSTTGGNGGAVATVYYAVLNSDGSIGTWATNANALPVNKYGQTSVTANGYIYSLAGNTGSGVDNAVYYASTQRVQVGGSLDLIGLAGQNLANGGYQSLGSSAGSITAGDVNVVGTLQVQGQGDFSQGLVANGNLSVSGYGAFQNAANSATAFEVLNAGGNQVLTVDTVSNSAQGLVVLGKSNTDMGQLVFDDSGSANTASLLLGGTLGGNATFDLPNLSGTQTICTTNTSSCSTAGSGYILNQSATPGSPQTGNFNITGTGIAGTALLTPSLDVAAAGTLTVGNSTATALTIGKSGVVTTFPGTAYINTNSTTALNVEQNGVHNNVLTVDTTNGLVGIDAAPTSGIALSVNGTTQASTFTLTSSATTNNIQKNYTAGAGGVTSGDVVVLVNDSGNSRVIDTTSARDTRVMGVSRNTVSSGTGTGIVIAGNTTVTADTGAVAIGDQLVTSTTSGQVTVDNNATAGILGYATQTKAGGSSGSVGVYVHPVNGVTNPTFTGNVTIQGSSALTLGSSSNTGKALFLDGTADGFTGTVQLTGAIGSSQTYNLPTTGGTFCLTTQNCSTAGSGYILNQSSTPGSAQTGNFNISGTGIAATLQGSTSVLTPLIDTASAGTLTVGNTSATAIALGKTGSNIATTINGTALVKPTSGNDSTTAFQVQNAAGTSLVNVNTTANAANLVTNGSFEQNTTGWLLKGSATIAQTTSQAYSGTGSLAITTSATAQDGAKQNITLTAGQAYEMSVLVRSSANFGTFAFGYSADGSTEATYVSSSNSSSSSAWTRFTLSFTPAAVSGTPYIFFKQTSATARTIYIDAVELEQSSFANPYREGQITLNGSIVSPFILQNTSDATQALAVYDSSGNNVLNIDTKNDRVGVGTTVPSATFVVANNSGRGILTVDGSANTTTLGNISATVGAPVAGTLIFGDGTTDNFGATLNTSTLTASRTISLPNEAGTLCTNASAGVCTTAGSGFIFNQSSTPGSAQTGNFNITGTGIAGTALESPLLDVASAGTLSVGTSTATAISVGKSGVTTTIAGALQVNNTEDINVNSTTALNVEQNGVKNNVLTVDTTNGGVGVNQTPASGVGLGVTGSIVSTSTIQGTNITSLSGASSNGFLKTYAVGTGGVTSHDVVVLANDGGVSKVLDTTTSHDTRVMGVAFSTSGSGTNDAIVIGGNTTVTADTGAVAIGDQLVTSTTSGQVTVDNNATTGVLGYATGTKSSGASGTVGVYVRAVGGVTNPNIPGNLTVQGTGASSFAGSVTIAPTANSVVALTVKGTTGTAANVLEVFNSAGSPTRQDFFDSSGSLNVGQVIQPTSGNAIDLGLSGTTFRTGYFGTSVVTPLVQTADSGSADTTALVVRSGNESAGSAHTSGAVTLQSGNGTGTNSSSGNVTVDTGSKTGTGTAGNLYLGNSNALNVQVGRNSSVAATDATLLLEGTASTSKIIASDSTDANELQIGFATPTAARTVTFPNASGNVCLDTGNCSGATGYILNQSAADQTADFRISGIGRANTSLLTPLLDTPSGTTTLNIGTNNATAGINLNQSVTVASGKSVTIQGNTTQSNGTVSLTANGASSFSTSTGALTLTGGGSSTWSTSAGDLSIQAAANLNIGNGGGTAINIGTNTGAHTILVGTDATNAQSVTLGSTNSSSTVMLKGGATSETVANGGDTIRTGTSSTGNSSTAFAVQNGQGATVADVGTSDTNLILNPGAEVAFGSEWAAYGSNTTVSRDTTTAWNGAASVKTVITPSTASRGAQNNLGAALTTSTAYTLSFYAKLKSGDPAFADIAAAYSRDGTSGTEVACGSYNTQTVVSGGWTRVTCTFTTTGTAGNASAYIVIRQTASAARTFYLDGVQLEATSNVASAYGAGTLQLDAAIISPTNLQNTEDSTTAFSVQSAGGTTQLNVDTLNSQVTVSGQMNVGGTLQVNTISPTGAMTIGATGQQLTLQGNASTTLTATGGGFTTTLGFLNSPSGAVTYDLDRSVAAGTYLLCSEVAGSCDSSTGYLRKGVEETDNVTVTTSGHYLMQLANGGSGSTSVLKLDDGSGLNSVLNVTSAANINAGNATIFASNTLNNATGNLLDLQSTQGGTGASRFAVDMTGNVTQAGGSSTTKTVNGQTISSAANFTGTLTEAGALTVSAGGAGITGNSTVTGTLGVSSTLSETGTGAAELIVSGAPAVSNSSSLVQLGSAIGSGNGQGTFLGINAGSGYTGDLVNFEVNSNSQFKVTSGGVANATTAFSVGGTQGSSFGACGAGQYVASFQSSGGIVIGGTCTALPSSGGFLAKNQTSTETSSGAVAGDFYDFTNTNSGSSANVLTLTNDGSGNTLKVTSAVNPGSGAALIFASDTNAAPSGNLIDLQAGASPTSRFAVNASGNVLMGGTLDTETGVTLNVGASGGPTLTAIALNQNTTVASNKSFTAQGAALFQDATVSTTAFQVENAVGTPLLGVDTSTSTAASLLTNPSIEESISGNWTAKGTPTTFQQTSSQSYIGANSLEISAQATANQGAKQNITLTNSHTYSLSFEAKLDSGSNAFATLDAGYSSDGSTDTTCTLSSTTVVSTGWQRYTCQIATAGSHSGTPYVYIKQTDAVTHHWYVDAIQLEDNASARPFQDGITHINTTIDSPTVFKNQSDSTTALQVTNAAGTPLMTADTMNMKEIVGGTLQVGSTGGSGALVNNGSSTEAVDTLSNCASNCTITQSAVDNYTYIAIPQTTASITITVPNPTAATTYGKVLYITNTGTNPFSVLGTNLNNGSTATLIWANVNGTGTWTFAGADANGLQSAYNNSGTTNPQIQLSNTNGGIKIRDAASSTITNLMQISDSGGTANYLSVTSASSGTLGTGNITLNASAGGGSTRTIQIANQTTTTQTGDTLAIVSAAGNTSGAGGALTVTAGAGGTTGNGGAVTVSGGAAGGGNHGGGGATLQGGAATGTGTPGTASVLGGANAGANSGSAGGAVAITGAAGATSANSGGASAGAGGAITITSGAGGAGGGTGGSPPITNGGNGSNIVLQAGAGGAGTSTGTNGSGGSITLTPGAAGGTGGTPGVVAIDVPVFTSTTETVNASSYTVVQSDVDSFSTVVMTDSSFTNATVAIPNPSNTMAGRTVYIASASGNVPFFISMNSGGLVIYITANTTAQLIWNGAAWTASSADTSLQGVYNDTQTSPAVIVTSSATKNILFQAGSGDDNSSLFAVEGSAGSSVLQVDTTNTAAGQNLAQNGGVESAITSSDWPTTGFGTGVTVSRDTTTGEFASGTGSAKTVTTGSAASGADDKLGTALTINSTYIVSFSAKLSSGTFTDLDVRYNRDTSTQDALCSTGSAASSGTSTLSSQTLSTSTWKKITCSFVTSGTTGTSNANLAIIQTAGASRTFFIDNLSIVLQNSTGTQDVSDLTVGGPLSQGLTLLTLDTYAGTPWTGNGNTALVGSMYYDTTGAELKCYDGAGWGTCGPAPNNQVTLTAEYPGAVLNGTLEANNNGTMTANLCSGSNHLSINPDASLCAASDEYTYYRWTTTQSSNAQLFDIFVKYQLPVTYKSFTVTPTLTARTTDTTNGQVTFTIWSPNNNTVCATSSAIGSANAWTSLNPGTGSCTFNAGDVIMFRVQMSAKSSSIAYASNITFTTAGK